MWICPKCKREFKRINQGHFCGEAPKSVEAYIEGLEEKARRHCSYLHQLLSEYYPKEEINIAWSMPSYGTKRNSIQFNACKNHISFYVGEDIIEIFKEDLEGYTCKKAVIYFPYDKGIDEELIRKMMKEIRG